MARLVPSVATLFPLLVGLLSLCPSTHAQVSDPVQAEVAYSAFVDGRAFYIGGGAIGGMLDRQQNFAIDLSVSWNVSKPRYLPLPGGPSTVIGESGMSADNKQWVVRDEKAFSAYNVETTRWTTIANAPVSDQGSYMAGLVTDPETGIIYSPATRPPAMLRLNLTSKTHTSISMPTMYQNVNGFRAIWSAPLKKLLLIGGQNYNGVASPKPFLALSYTEGKGWEDISKQMKGKVPSPRMYFCLVPAYGGSKLVLFGGYVDNQLNNGYSPEIYVLDAATMTWTKGANSASDDARIEPACAASGDYFIAWGGENESVELTGAKLKTAIYNIKTNKWTNTYIPPAPPATTTTITGVPTSSPISSSIPSGTPSGTPSVSSERSAGSSLRMDHIVALGSGVVAAAVLAIGI